ncbi:MAG: MBL fold metallo-hydrolase [Candidatus Heimdallarchaeota archaeon]
MSLTRRAKILISLGVILGVTAAGIPAIVVPLYNHNTITFTLLDNAGVMIEARGLRIYIDPISLPAEYAEKPADAVLITHQHSDHYQLSMVNLLQKNDTLNVFPAIMVTAINYHDGLAVVPEDQFQVGSITVTAFYMYTFPVDIYPASHPQEDNYTSYLIDIDGFTIFHAGDSKNIEEYEDLAGLVDVALLPLGPGCQTMADLEIVDVLDVIQPTYFIPIHFGLLACETFITSYGDLLTDCELIHMEYFTTHKFKIDS